VKPPSAITGPVYLDTSALVKLYLPEPDSASVERALRRRRDLVVSDLAITEVASAVSRRAREGALSRLDAGRLYRQLLAHAEAGVFLRADIVPETHREAERLLLSLAEVPLRSLDALHLALAIGAGARSLFTFDMRLAAAGLEVGLASAP
jgi:hypothetical protein